MKTSTQNALMYVAGAGIALAAYLWWKKNRQISESVLSPMTLAPYPAASLPPASLPLAATQKPLPAIWGYRRSPTEPFLVGYDNGTDGGQGVGYNYLIGLKNPYTLLALGSPIKSLPYGARNSVGDTSAIEMAQGNVLAKMQEMVRSYIAQNPAV